jgi:hypothetical protein
MSMERKRQPFPRMQADKTGAGLSQKKKARKMSGLLQGRRTIVSSCADLPHGSLNAIFS